MIIKVLEGENDFLSKQRLSNILDDFKKEKPWLDVNTINADILDASQIIQKCQTHLMFSQDCLIIIKRLINNKKYKEIIENIINKEINIPIVIWEEKKIPKNTRYFKILSEKKIIESFPKFNRRTFINWAKENTKEIEMKDDLIDELAMLTNYNPYSFLNEVNKIKNLERKFIKKEDLNKYIYNNYEYEIWDLINSINKSKNSYKISTLVSKLLDSGLSTQHILTLLARNLKQTILVHTLVKKGFVDKDIIKLAKIPPFTYRTIKEKSLSISQEDLINLYEKVYNLDYQIKTGKIDGCLGLTLLSSKL